MASVKCPPPLPEIRVPARPFSLHAVACSCAHPPVAVAPPPLPVPLPRLQCDLLPVNFPRQLLLSPWADFVRTVLQRDPAKRPSAAQLLQHRWIRQHQLLRQRAMLVPSQGATPPAASAFVRSASLPAMAIAAAKSAAAGASKLAPAPSAAASLASMLPGSSAGSSRSLVQAASGSSGSNDALLMLADTAVAASNGGGGGGCLSTAPSTASCATLTAELCHTCSNCQLGEDSSSRQVAGASCHHHNSGSGVAGGSTSEDAEMAAPELSAVDPGSALPWDAEAEAEAGDRCCSRASGGGGGAAQGMPPSPFAARQLGGAAPGAPARPSLLSLPLQLGIAGMQLEEAAGEPPELPPAPLLGIQAALDAEAAQLAAKYGVWPEQQGRQSTRSRLGPAGASRLLAGPEAGAATAGSSDDMRLQKTGQRNRIVAYIHRQKASVLRTFNRFPRTRGDGASSGSGSDDDIRPPAAA